MAAAQRRETQRLLATHARSAALAKEDAQHYLFGVPLHWMRDWPTPAALHIERARGNRLWCADGHEHVDFCLGDTGARCSVTAPSRWRGRSRSGRSGA